METPTRPTTFNPEAYDDLVRQYSEAPGPEARAKIISGNPDLVKAGVLSMRQLERSQLPLYAQVLGRAEENSVYDKFRLARDAALTGMVIALAWKGAKVAYTWLKGPM